MRTQGNTPKDVRALRYVSLAAGTIGAMAGEFVLATQTGMDPRVAWTYPVALDAYAVVAFRTGKRGDVATALGLMAVSQTLTHLVSARVIPMCWPVVVAVWAVILPLVIWRTHNAAHAAPVTQDEPETAPAAPVAPSKPSVPVSGPIVPAAALASLPTAPVTPSKPSVDVTWIGPGAPRKNWRRDEAIRFVREHAHLTTEDLAKLMGRTPRMVNIYRGWADTVAA